MNTHAKVSVNDETEYARLRRELEAAYAQPIWNSRLIDRLADSLARLEWASMRRVMGQSYALEQVSA